MSRRAAKITTTEVKRFVTALQAAGIPIARVTFDGERVDVIVSKDDNVPHSAKPKPERFETLEEWRTWKDASDASRYSRS